MKKKIVKLIKCYECGGTGFVVMGIICDTCHGEGCTEEEVLEWNTQNIVE